MNEELGLFDFVMSKTFTYFFFFLSALNVILLILSFTFDDETTTSTLHEIELAFTGLYSVEIALVSLAIGP